MRVMTWNVNKSSNREGRIDDQLRFVRDRDVNVLLLQEVRYGRDSQWLSRWTEGLEEMGLGEIEHSCDWAAELAESNVPPHSDIGHDNGHLTACDTAWSTTRREHTIRNHLDEDERGYFDTHFPEKILVATLETESRKLDVWNVRAVPGNGWGEEKVKLFETIYNRLRAEGRETRILAGDLNSPDEELSDGQAVPFGYDKDDAFRRRKVRAELNVLKGLGHLGMRDVFRELHGYGDVDVADTSWRTKRFDHVFASMELTADACYYDHSGFECSDHAPIVVEFDL